MRFCVEARGAADIRDYFKRLKGAVIDEGALIRAAEMVKEGILKRTGSGLDAAGRPFKPYTKAYKKRREKAGRQTDAVDLEFTGRMLKDVVCVVRGAQAEVTFSASESRVKAAGAEGIAGRRNRTKREFFALSSSDKDAVAGLFSEQIDRVLTSGTAGLPRS